MQRLGLAISLFERHAQAFYSLIRLSRERLNHSLLKDEEWIEWLK
jgi:hypothetical protein